MSLVRSQFKFGARLKTRWNAPSGYKAILAMAGPLVLSTGSVAVQQFIDRMFLSWYSRDAFAASLPAGFFSFTIMCFFLGTASYANTFVAQYHGAGQSNRVASAVWQSIYFSILAGAAVLIFVPLARPIFNMAGHEPAIREQEIIYFRIMMWGGGFGILSSAVSCFFTGLGRTWVVMLVNVAATLINVVLDYAMIFGRLGFPEMGMKGAALATVVSTAFGVLAFFVIFLSGRNRIDYNTHKSWRINTELFGRMMRFGVPSGAQFMLDSVSFSLFIMFVGRLGANELGATNLAMQINTLAFLPMIGFAIATSTLVGQRLGENNPRLAARATWSAFHLTFLYMSIMAILYVAVPKIFIAPFAAKADHAEFAEMYPVAIIILRFVAVYSIFDTMNIVFASALKGAGDTVFVMYLSTGLGLGMMVIPTWLITLYGGGIISAWIILTVFIITLGLCFFRRFVKGGWQNLRVIEISPPKEMEYAESDEPIAQIKEDSRCCGWK